MRDLTRKGDSAADRRAWAAHLEEGERILWQGIPDQRLIRFRLRDGFYIPFFLVWAGVPTVGIFMDPSLIFSIIPLIFTLIGAYALIGRFFVDGWRRRATAYLLTDRKALIAQAWPRVMVRSVSMASGPQVQLEGRTVRIGDTIDHRNMALVGLAPPGVVFELIDDAERVYQMAARAALPGTMADR